MYNVLHPLYPKLAITTTGTVVVSQTLTVGTAASAFSTTFNTMSNLVMFDVQGYAVRVRFDGTDPTATVGHYLPAATAYTWDKDMAARAKFIRDTTSTGNATIFLTECAG